jgi:FkbM family methyltransferase
MTTDAILSNLEEATSNARLRFSWIDMLVDHGCRVAGALGGFRVYGRNWLKPWTAYCLSPILNRVAHEKIARCKSFNARFGECDLYTFANVFADYPVDELVWASRDVELIVDLGANVGAFSCLMRTLSPQSRIIAVEPDATNVAFLRAQPFADSLEIHQAAVGPFDGMARLIRGENSVTHHVDLSGDAEGAVVPVISLQALCDQPSLVKMDIEGGERRILECGLPKSIRHLVLEWHHRGSPADFVRGRWKRISTDIHGASTWYFRR